MYRRSPARSTGNLPLEPAPSSLPEERITDREPSLICTVGGLQAAAYVIRAPDAEITRVTLLEQGWLANANALSCLGKALVRDHPGRAAVVLQQPRVPLPVSFREISAHLREVKPSKVRRLRTDTALSVGAAVCKRYGVESLDLITHSLGTVDGAHMAVESSRRGDLQVTSLTALAPAALLPSAEIPAAVWNANAARCEKASINLRSRLAEGPIQLLSEAMLGLGQISEQLAELDARGTRLYGADFVNDKLFHRKRQPEVFTGGYTVITEGCACHNAASHPEEAGRISRVIDDLHAGRYAPDRTPSFTAMPARLGVAAAGTV